MKFSDDKLYTTFQLKERGTHLRGNPCFFNLANWLNKEGLIWHFGEGDIADGFLYIELKGKFHLR